jgi:hypothetical protein
MDLSLSHVKCARFSVLFSMSSELFVKPSHQVTVFFSGGDLTAGTVSVVGAVTTLLAVDCVGGW